MANNIGSERYRAITGFGGVSVRLAFVGSAEIHAELATLLAPDTLDRLDRTAAAAEIRAGRVSLLIVDLSGPLDQLMPAYADLQVAAIRRPLPVLALVHRTDERTLAAAFEAGVADVAGLPLVAGEVTVRIRLMLRRAGIADHFRARARDAHVLAMTDPVTQLFNRHYFNAEAARAVVRARAFKVPLTVMMADIDALKPVNDAYGHAAGDRVLAAVAARLTANLRSGDIVARFGGDEIAVAMPATDLDTATRVATRLCNAVADEPVDGLAGRGVTVSIGVAALRDADPDAPALMARADAALYQGKRGGRNRVEIAA